MSRTNSPGELDAEVVPHGRARRFTILEHRWGGVHWDFLVEDRDGGPLRTWAIDEPIRPGVTLAARALPDHRRLYLDYEGPIAGDRGEVARWDSGTARVELWEEGEVRLAIQGRQLLGMVRFWLDDGGADAPDSSRRWLFRFWMGKLS